jgi:hypothetical protein
MEVGEEKADKQKKNNKRAASWCRHFVADFSLRLRREERGGEFKENGNLFQKRFGFINKGVEYRLYFISICVVCFMYEYLGLPGLTFQFSITIILIISLIGFMLKSSGRHTFSYAVSLSHCASRKEIRGSTTADVGQSLILLASEPNGLIERVVECFCISF